MASMRSASSRSRSRRNRNAGKARRAAPSPPDLLPADQADGRYADLGWRRACRPAATLSGPAVIEHAGYHHRAAQRANRAHRRIRQHPHRNETRARPAVLDTPVRKTVDPVTFEVLNHRLMTISEEMGIQYMRCSGSNVLITGNDAAAAVMLAGRLAGVGRALHRHAGQRAAADRREHDALARPGRVDRGRRHLHLQRSLSRRHPPSRHRDRRADLLEGQAGRLGRRLRAPARQRRHGSRRLLDQGRRYAPGRPAHAAGQARRSAAMVREDVLRWIRNQVRDPLVALDVKGQIASLNSGRRAGARADRALGCGYGQGRDAPVHRLCAREAAGAAGASCRTACGARCSTSTTTATTPKIYKIVCTLTKNGRAAHVRLHRHQPQRARPDQLDLCRPAGRRA